MKRTVLIIFTFTSCFAAISTTFIQPLDQQDTMTRATNESIIIELIERIKEGLMKDMDAFPELIREAEGVVRLTKDSATAALLHSMIAEMYNSYYHHMGWQFNQRTPITGYIPDNIREWTRNLFQDKINEEIRLSLQPEEVLQQTPVRKYASLLKLGEDSPTLRPTLYDFLVYRALEMNPSRELYEALICFRKTQPEETPLLLAELDYLDFSRSFTDSNDYWLSLDSLAITYKESPLLVEIVNTQFNLMERAISWENQDSVKGVLYNRAQELLRRFPGYNRIGLIKNQLNTLEQPYLRATSLQNGYPGKEFTVHLDYINIPSVTIQIYKLSAEQLPVYFNKTPDIPASSPVRTMEWKLNPGNSYTQYEDTLSFTLHEPGVYLYHITTPESEVKTSMLFSISRLAAVYRDLRDQGIEVFVTDFLSGEPIADATVKYFRGTYEAVQPAGSIRTGRNGIAVIPFDGSIRAFQATTVEDNASLLTGIFMADYVNYERSSEELKLITDRGVYRPGQTVYVKGIAFTRDLNNPQVIPDRTYEIVLRDANDKEIAKKTFKTNEYGSFNGDFQLPPNLLNGRFSLSTENGWATFQVEEYKRPGFSIRMAPVTEDIARGDTVIMQGEAETFSSADLTGGEVAYRVNRQMWGRIPTPAGNNQVAEGKAGISGDGTFTFTFVTDPVSGNQPFWYPGMGYTIWASVTDNNGETQETTYHLPVHEAAFRLSLDHSTELIDKNGPALDIRAITPTGKIIAVSGTYEIVRLKDNKYINEREEQEILFKDSFEAGKGIGSSVLRNLPSGRVRIKLSATDSKGRLVMQEQDKILYSKKDKKPPVFSDIWLVPENQKYTPGDNVEIIFGTSFTNVHMLVEVFADNRILSRDIILLNDELRSLHIPFPENEEKGIAVYFTFIKNGDISGECQRLEKKYPNRELTIRPETFRDHLLPGKNETWSFKITDINEIPVQAEVLAVMTDASLDQILPYSIYFEPEPSTYFPIYYFNTSTGLGNESKNAQKKLKAESFKKFSFDAIDWRGGLPRIYMPTTRSRMAYASLGNDMVEESIVQTMSLADKVDEGLYIGEADGTSVATSVPAGIRRNFNETAFFFPVLRTDKEGKILFTFTLPESTTTWNLTALAHTKEVTYGLWKEQVVTQKPVMVLPHLPRFLRKGDKVSISSTLLNESGKEIHGTVRLELFDPVTEELISTGDTQKTFEAGIRNNPSVTWDLHIPVEWNMIGVRIIAETPEGSDGEQHLIPVVADEILITESKPFYLSDEKEKTVTLPPSVFGSKRPLDLTAEVSANPVWYAVQALPTLSVPANGNAVDWFASYFSNTLAGYIIRTHPRLESVIRIWSAENEKGNGLSSGLQQNEELKQLLLQETPWVMEAENETERMRQLQLLFDPNRAIQAKNNALRELKELQLSNGAWGWYKGMYPDRMITLFILNGMAELTELNAIEYNQEEKEMQMKALAFLDREIKQEFDRITSKKEYIPSAFVTSYLFTRSYYRDIPEAGESVEAIRWFTNNAVREWEQASFYNKVQIALLLHRNGEKEVAHTIAGWFRKAATITSGEGMYWKNNTATPNQFHSPVAAHILCMKMFEEIAPESRETEWMKQWLLNQKRTQSWESVPATVQAVYQLLLSGRDWVAENNEVTIQWGNKIIDSRKGASAIGYVKEKVTSAEINSSFSEAVIHKTGQAPAWGAFYTRYFMKMEDVTASIGKSLLSVDKKLFIETNSGTYRQIKPLTGEETLKVGTKVVTRLTIRADREMDYVHVKDMRSGCIEPSGQLSGSIYGDGLVYYRNSGDLSENFFFDKLPVGTYVIEFSGYVSRTGEFNSGITTIQCMYAPEFVSQTAGGRITVN